MLFLGLALLVPLFDVFAASVPRIKVLALFRDKAMLEINGDQVMMKAGDETDSGIRLVQSTSKVAVIEINGVRKKYELGSQVSTRLSEPENTVVRIPSRGGMYLTHGLINGRIVKFLVDTGASMVTMARPTADRLQIQYRDKGTPVQISTASKMHNAWRVKLNSVAVGGIQQDLVDGVVIDTDHDQEILLGMSYLNRLKFSQERGMVVLEARSN
jgi:aspartyl protease family protein